MGDEKFRSNEYWQEIYRLEEKGFYVDYGEYWKDEDNIDDEEWVYERWEEEDYERL